MTPEHHEPLDNEERELARRLARLDATAEPSPALDARVLAAARAAPGVRGARISPVRPRWHLGLGLAASLALAVGIAWQVRPLPEPGQFAPEPADAAGIRDDRPARAPREAAEAVEVAGADAMLPPPAASDDAAGAQAPEHAKAAAADPAEARAPPPGPAEASTAATAPAPPLGQASGTAAQDIDGPTPLPGTPSATTGAAPGTTPTRTSAAARADDAAAERRQRSAAATDMHATEAGDPFHDEAFDEEPPASADSPEVQRAWLARIRELVAEGRLEAARASLREFRRRFPLTPLPEDLRSLAD